jgi:hypothetical protein
MQYGVRGKQQENLGEKLYKIHSPTFGLNHSLESFTWIVMVHFVLNHSAVVHYLCLYLGIEETAEEEITSYYAGKKMFWLSLRR